MVIKYGQNGRLVYRQQGGVPPSVAETLLLQMIILSTLLFSLWFNFPNWASLVAQLVKNMPPIWETWARSLGWEDPLEKGKAPHSSVLAWRIPWTVQPMRLQRNGNNWATHFHFYFFPQNRSKSHSYKKQIVSKGEKGGGINWEIEIDCITQEILLITLTYVGIES